MSHDELCYKSTAKGKCEFLLRLFVFNTEEYTFTERSLRGNELIQMNNVNDRNQKPQFEVVLDMKK